MSRRDGTAPADGRGRVQIRYLDGRRFRRAVLAGIEWLHQQREHLNEINVYPVPDADTGTNMSLTMRSAAEGLKQQLDRAIDLTSRDMADHAILGSQGNSGAILAQFLKGLSDGLKGKARITTMEFAQAAERAKHSAYAALARPREGTILTVIKDWSDHIESRWRESEDFVELLKGALAKARESLKRTPDQLQVLKDHGVVDAGAAGFINLLEGITEYVETGNIRASAVLVVPGDGETPVSHVRLLYGEGPELLTYRYCTECVVRTPVPVQRSLLESELQSLGDSLVVVMGDSVVKIHLHTNEPSRLYEVAGSFGVILRRKCDDMQAQHVQAVSAPRGVAVVTDSACDLPADLLAREPITVVPLKVIFGDEVFLDRIEISPSGFLDRCRTSSQHPKTSQPAVSDFLRGYELAARRGREIVVVCLSGAVSGTFEAARAAAVQFKGAAVHVVDSRSVSVAEGLLVREAFDMAEAGESGKAIAEKIEELKTHVRLFISLRSLDFAHRGGRVSAGKNLLAKMLGIKPVVSFNAEGRSFSAAAAFGDHRVEAKVVALARAEWSRYKRFRVAVAHMDAPEVARYYAERIRALAGIADVPVVEATPVLGAHSGPGAAAIAVLGLA